MKRRSFDSFDAPKSGVRVNDPAASDAPQASPERRELLPIWTQRLVLRRFAGKDASAFCAYRNDPEVARYQGWEGCTETEARDFVGKHGNQPFGVPGEWLQIAIAAKDSDALVGDCAVRIHPQDVHQATIGVTFARSHQRQGLAREALAGLLDGLFGSAGLHRVVADTDPRNVASWSLLERLGLRREGHLKQSRWFKGEWADEYLYAILSKDWLAGRGSAGPGAGRI